jgi:hypothetical protein
VCFFRLLSESVSVRLILCKSVFCVNVCACGVYVCVKSFSAIFVFFLVLIGKAVMTSLAGSGNHGFADGVGTHASFRNPYGVAVDASGNAFVADYGNQRIRKISSTGGTSEDCFSTFHQLDSSFSPLMRLIAYFLFWSREFGGGGLISQSTLPTALPPRAGRWAVRHAWPARPAHSAPPVRATPPHRLPCGCALVCPRVFGLPS